MEAEATLPERLAKALRSHRTDDALRLLADPKNAGQLENESCHLVPILCQYLTEPIENEDVFECAKQLLDIISERTNPEEILLVFVGEIEEAPPLGNLVPHLLEPLSKIIFRCRGRKLNCLSWTFQALQHFTGQLDMSESLKTYKKIVEFYEKIISNLDLSEDFEVRIVLVKYLVELLQEPFAHLPVDNLEGRRLAENVIENVFKITRDPLSLLVTRNSLNITISQWGLGNLFYFVYSEEKNMCFEFTPKVYNPSYTFQTSLRLVNNLLQSDSDVLTEKAVKLATSLTLPSNAVTSDCLDQSEQGIFCSALCRLVVTNRRKALRKQGLNLLTNYISSFDFKGQYLIILHIIRDFHYQNLNGFLISWFKDNVLMTKHNLNIFTKSLMFKLLRAFCLDLKNKRNEEDDSILQNSDQIVASLNFLRFLTLKDKNNLTGFWDFLDILREIYLDPLRKSLDASRGNYEVEMKMLDRKGEVEKKMEDVSLTVDSQDLTVDAVDREEKVRILNQALTTIDVIDSLLCRVLELISE